MIKDMKRQKDIQSFDFSMIGEEEQIILDVPNNGCTCESNEYHLANSKDDISVDYCPCSSISEFKDAWNQQDNKDPYDYVLIYEENVRNYIC